MQLPKARFSLFGLSSLTLALVAVAAPVAVADVSFDISPDGRVRPGDGGNVRPPEVLVHRYDETGLEATFELRGLALSRQATEAGDFVRVRAPESPVAGEKGMPELPVIRRLIGVPDGAGVKLEIREGRSAVIDLKDCGFTGQVLPVQTPLSLDPFAPKMSPVDDPVEQGIPEALSSLIPSSFVQDRAAYAADVLHPAARVTVKEVGVFRGLHLHLMEVRPVAYNPVRSTLTVWSRLHVKVRFTGGVGGFRDVRPSASMSHIVLNPPSLNPPAERGSGNYLIITADDFTDSTPVTQFASFKAGQGYDVAIHTMTSGTTAPTLKSYLESLWGTPDAPDYIVIMADAIDAAITAASNSIPGYPGGGTRYIRTDVPYACMDGPDDWVPDIPIGRFPARTVSVMQDIVDKVIYVETGNFSDPGYAERATFISSTDPSADAETLNNDIIDTYMVPNGIQCNKIYMGSLGSTTQDLSDAINNGCFLTSYFGHSAGFQAWATPPFVFSDIEALTNQDMYPFVVGFSCSGAAFHYVLETKSPGFLEKWLREPAKGAAAAYGTVMSLDPYTFDTWETMYRKLYLAIYSDGIRELGPAYQAAAVHFVAYYGPEDPLSRDFTEEFVLLGDPSMRLPDPPADNYLIVSAPAYVASAPLNQFIAAKEAMGFEVSTYSVPNGTSNSTIKSYILTLIGTEDEPDYILLVGDTDGFSSTLNTVPHFNGGGDKQAPTDWPYGCVNMGDDWYPDIPVGRFSVRTIDSLQDVVDKTLFVEAGDFPDPDYVKRGAFLANPSTYGCAEPTHDWVIDTYFTPNDYDGIKLYAAEGADTQDVTDAVNNGALFTLYFGHSASGGWWDPSFGQSDVSALSNTGLYGLAFGWSCNTADYTSSECFGETWLRAPEKGAAAYISASDYIYWGSAAAWAPSVASEKAFFTAIFEDDLWEIGPAWMAGMYRFLADYGGWDGDPDHPPTQHEAECRNFFEEFTILGDPSLRLPQPDGFTLASNPETRDLCSPPDDEAVYTVTVGLQGSFAEAVTLDATGLPTGATVDFDINGQAPPFISVTTVGGLDGSMAGEYDIVVTGTSASKQRSLIVALSISSSVPEAPTLTSPPDDATGVARAPTLSWQEPSGALSYILEVATDVGFANIVYSQAVTESSHQLGIYLDSLTEYFWHVQAVNGCGSSGFSSPFSFTTLAQADYFTEQFLGGGDSFDLDGFTLSLIPDGSGSYYDACITSIHSLPTDPSGGTTLVLDEDGSQSVTPMASVPLYGTHYDSFYVNANGNISFTTPDSTWTQTLEAHFSQPRISALFDDFSPQVSGTVSWKPTNDSVVVTWQDVPEYSSGGSNTFQVEMYFAGKIDITWWGVDSNDSIVGVSQGDGIPTDYLEFDLSAAGGCAPPPTGACCDGEACSVVTPTVCTGAGGEYQGDETTCDPNPCVTYNPSCLIISEVVQGTESGDCPRWMEITNTSTSDFVFIEGGIIVQTDASSDVDVDVDLSGNTIAAGQSFTINSRFAGACTGAYPVIYGQAADFETNVPFGFGNERLIITDTADGSHLIDIYGEFGVDGTGQSWEFTDGYSYRLSAYNTGVGQDFAPGEWLFGGVGSLAGADPTQLLLDNTTPGTHVYDEVCGLLGDIDLDGDVDLADFNLLADCLAGPDVTDPLPACDPADFANADLDNDSDVDLVDFEKFQGAFD